VNLTDPAGATVIDNGALTIASAASATFAGVLSGSGGLTEDGPGVLTLSGTGSAFSGEVTISGGSVVLAKAGAIGAGAIAFEAAGASVTLKIGSGAAPTSGGTFANTLTDFDNTGDSVDLTALTWSAGAVAILSGSILTLTDGGKSYNFNLAGETDSAYAVTSDTGGGTLITPSGEGDVVRFAQVIAAFGATSNAQIEAITATAAHSAHGWFTQPASPHFHNPLP
jgi:autotransporter-associated beta strand protein